MLSKIQRAGAALNFREEQVLCYPLLSTWLISLDKSFYGNSLLIATKVYVLYNSKEEVQLVKVRFFLYLIHSNQIVTAVNKHFEKQAGIPLFLEEN